MPSYHEILCWYLDDVSLEYRVCTCSAIHVHIYTCGDKSDGAVFRRQGPRRTYRGARARFRCIYMCVIICVLVALHVHTLYMWRGGACVHACVHEAEAVSCKVDRNTEKVVLHFFLARVGF